jgi:hypothetical protein
LASSNCWFLAEVTVTLSVYILPSIPCAGLERPGTSLSGKDSPSGLLQNCSNSSLMLTSACAPGVQVYTAAVASSWTSLFLSLFSRVRVIFGYLYHVHTYLFPPHILSPSSTMWTQALKTHVQTKTSRATHVWNHHNEIPYY